MNHKAIPNDTDQPGLSPRQEAVALGVASGLTLAAAARKVRVGIPTAKRWSSTLPAFRQRVQELRGELTSRGLGLLLAAQEDAATTLRDLLCAQGSKGEAVRLGAAKATFELAARLRETTELDALRAELTELKAALSKGGDAA